MSAETRCIIMMPVLYSTLSLSQLQQESNVAANAKPARTNFVLACQSNCTQGNTDPDLIGEAVQSLYRLLFEQSNPVVVIQAANRRAEFAVDIRIDSVILPRG